MTLQEYQERAMTTCLPPSENAGYMLLNLVGEVGEFCSKVAKHIRKEEMTFSAEPNFNDLAYTDKIQNLYEADAALEKEAGDILWQLSGLCTVMGGVWREWQNTTSPNLPHGSRTAQSQEVGTE